METVKYVVHTWLDFVAKLQKYTPFAHIWSTTEERKNDMWFYLYNPGITHKLNGPIPDSKRGLASIV